MKRFSRYSLLPRYAKTRKYQTNMRFESLRWYKIRISPRRDTPLRTEGRSLAVRTYGCVQVYMCVHVCVCAEECKKRVTHGTYTRQCMLALLPFLAPPPHPSALSLALSAMRSPMYVCIMEARHARTDEGRYTLCSLPLRVVKRRTRRKHRRRPSSCTRTGHEGRARRSCFQFTTAITIACAALRLRTIGSLLFASVMYIATKIVERSTSLFSRDIPSLANIVDLLIYCKTFCINSFELSKLIYSTGT